MAEDDGQSTTVVNEKVYELAAELIDLTSQRDTLDEQISELRAVLGQMMASNEAVMLGELTVVNVPRRPAATINAVALLNAGIEKEEFCTIKPSVTKLRECARNRGWTADYLGRYLTRSEEVTMTPTVTKTTNTIYKKDAR